MIFYNFECNAVSKFRLLPKPVPSMACAKRETKNFLLFKVSTLNWWMLNANLPLLPVLCHWEWHFVQSFVPKSSDKLFQINLSGSFAIRLQKSLILVFILPGYFGIPLTKDELSVTDNHENILKNMANKKENVTKLQAEFSEVDRSIQDESSSLAEMSKAMKILQEQIEALQAENLRLEQDQKENHSKVRVRVANRLKDIFLI